MEGLPEDADVVFGVGGCPDGVAGSKVPFEFSDDFGDGGAAAAARGGGVLDALESGEC